MKKTIEELKVEIKEKFKTFSHFAKIAGLDRYEFQRDFLSKTDRSKVDPEYLKVILDALKRNRSADDKLAELKKEIEDMGGVYFFCKKNPQFSNITVADILRGKIFTISPVVQELLDHFEIK